MINMFYDTVAEDWEIATRSAAGAEVGFAGKAGEKPRTFRSMFLDACGAAGVAFDKLPTDLCYSFVLQHPDNCIATPISEKRLYLVAAYRIDAGGGTVTEQPRSTLEEICTSLGNRIFLPASVRVSSYEEAERTWAGPTTPCSTQGVIIRHTSSGDRMKFRNPKFEAVRRLRGNQAKLQFRYLELRRERTVTRYLSQFPADAAAFDAFKAQVHSLTDELQGHYMSVHVQKSSSIEDVPPHLRTHIKALHYQYRHRLRPNGQCVRRATVVAYVNSLPSARLMHAINVPRPRAVAGSAQ